ncbi:MAG: hypothetical protein ABL949_14950 [Fimbriimonadaceae bacterium]
MANLKRGFWKQYLGYLSVTCLIALGTSPPFLVRFGWVPSLLMFAFSGWAFGSAFCLLGLITKHIRLRSFLLQMLEIVAVRTGSRRRG